VGEGEGGRRVVHEFAFNVPCSCRIEKSIGVGDGGEGG